MNPYRSILAATDFTVGSAPALHTARILAERTGAALHLVHVIHTGIVMELRHALTKLQQDIEDQLRRSALEEWNKFAKEQAPLLAATPLDVRIDNRIVGILRAAKDAKADLVVAGAFGERKPETGVGTVAGALLRKCPADVLLIRDTGTALPRRIVVAVDFSANAERALVRAAMLASATDGEVHVLHIYDVPWSELQFRAAAQALGPEYEGQYRTEQLHRFEALWKPVAAQYPKVRFVPHFRDAARRYRSDIARFVREEEADLLILGVRGQTNLRDTLLGSTAERALEESSSSVLAVKPADFEGGNPTIPL